MASTSDENDDSGVVQHDSSGKDEEHTQTDKKKAKRQRLSGTNESPVPKPMASPVTKSIQHLTNAISEFTGEVRKAIFLPEIKRIKALKRITMATDLGMNWLKQSEKLLDNTIEKTEALVNANNQQDNTQASTSKPPSSQNQGDDVPSAQSDTSTLTPPRQKSGKAISSPITNTICDLDSSICTFVATCSSEVMKNFETDDKNKVDRLRQLQKHTKKILELLQIESDIVQRKSEGYDFTDLPTKRVLLSEEERKVIEVMRTCKEGKEDIVDAFKKHYRCSQFCISTLRH